MSTRTARSASTPHPHTSTTSAATHILAISNSDALAYQTYGDPTPLDYKRAERLRLAQAYIYKAKGRLSKTDYSRLLRALDAHGRSADVDETREEIGKVFGNANEYELWEEFLECFMGKWLYMQGRKEEREGIKEQFRVWARTAFK
ncbi:MAG: hypothetical protein Q9208_002747 [Pyrenodesmia sp. 3 TL-2023]